MIHLEILTLLWPSLMGRDRISGALLICTERSRVHKCTINSLQHDISFDIKFRLPDQFSKLCLSVFWSEWTQTASKLNQQRNNLRFYSSAWNRAFFPFAWFSPNIPSCKYSPAFCPLSLEFRIQQIRVLLCGTRVMYRYIFLFRNIITFRPKLHLHFPLAFRSIYSSAHDLHCIIL